MSQDPFYEKIIAGLNGALNPQEFEDCVADLLRELFPTLVPVRGGKDSGMDGAIADGEGEPFPLVVTTGEDVERNLRSSLDSFVERRQPSRKVVFATSRALTPPRRLKLMDLARERGFTLVQVIDQRGVANLLYKSPHWYKQLLGLSGQPSALSVIPRSRRPLLDLEPIGRARDLEWLQQTTGDRVLSGEPGSGKTFLLYYLARQGWGLFLVDPDGDVAGALREQQPRIVILDDAHAGPRALENLRYLRQKTGMDFSIIATTWEGARNEVIEAMGGIPEDKVRKLELLTRAEILEVFRSAGVEENADTMRYLIDQAANKPGLAVTIATLWQAGAWREVLEGRILSRTLLAFFQEFVCPESTDVLAAFSLGGDRGMGMEAVRDFLGLSRLELRHVAAGLAAGGVLSEVDKDTLAVWPRPLRSSLIRTAFFPPPGQPRHPYQELIQKAPNSGRAVETLIAARSVGVQVPAEELQHLVAGVESLRAWNGLARLSEQDARWVLAKYKGDLIDIGRSVLLKAPGLAVEALLRRSASATESIHSNPDHPMRILADWVRELNAPVDELITRRRLLANAARLYILQEGTPSVGIQGICLALSPSMESRSLDPVAGHTLTVHSGLLCIDKNPEFEEIWKETLDAFAAVDASSWEFISAMLWEWIHPEYSGRSVEIPKETTDAMQAFAARLLESLATLSGGSPGLAIGLQELASKIGLQLNLLRDPEFEALYSSVDFEDYGGWESQEEIQLGVVKELAKKWVQSSSREIANRVARYEDEANKIRRTWPRRTPYLCRCLAALADEPEVWFDSFFEARTPSDDIEPFLRTTLERQRGDATQILGRCLGADLYVWIAAESILRMSDPPSQLFASVLERLASFPHFVETLCLRKQISLPNLKALLEHPDYEVSLAAAVGEWLSNPQREVRAELMETWRVSVLRSKSGQHAGYWLGEILKECPDLAFDWLDAHMGEEEDRFFLEEDDAFSKAARILSKEQRTKLLESLGSRVFPQHLVSLLVNRDPMIYRELLKLKDLSRFHLQPLGGFPESAWVDLALEALSAGYSERAIAEAASWPSDIRVSWGSLSQRWSRWDEAFAQFELDPREEVRAIAGHGRQIAQVEVQESLERERRRAIHGT